MSQFTERSRKGTIPPVRGRPRRPEVDARILEAALEEMSKHGYARTTVEAVAAAAGVSKPTVYLRYPTKAALATAALAYLRERSAVPETGDTRADLVLHLERFRAGAGRPFGMAMVGSVLAEEHDTPELLDRFRSAVVGPRRRLFRAVLERAAARGELRPDADLDAAVNALVGSYYAQYLSGAPFPEGWSERVVDVVLHGITAAG